MYIGPHIRGLSDGGKTRLAAGALAIMLGTAGLGLFGSCMYDKQVKKMEQELNNAVGNDIKIATDFYGEYGLDPKSFELSHMQFSADEKNVIRFVGTAKDEDGTTFNYAQATYKFDAEHYKKIVKNIFSEDAMNGVVNLENYTNRQAWDLLFNILKYFPEREFVDASVENVKSVEGELVFDLGTPQIDEKSGEVWCEMTLAKVCGDKIKTATIEISAPATEELMENPCLLYTFDRNKLHVEIEDISIIENTQKQKM